MCNVDTMVFNYFFYLFIFLLLRGNLSLHYATQMERYRQHAGKYPYRYNRAIGWVTDDCRPRFGEIRKNESIKNTTRLRGAVSREIENEFSTGQIGTHGKPKCSQTFLKRFRSDFCWIRTQHTQLFYTHRYSASVRHAVLTFECKTCVVNLQTRVVQPQS